MSRDRYRDQIVTISVKIVVTHVSLHSKTLPCTVHVYSTLMAHVHTLMHTNIEACFLCLFYDSIHLNRCVLNILYLPTTRSSNSTGVLIKYRTPVQEYLSAVIRGNGETDFCLGFVAQWFVHWYSSYIF